MGRWSRRVAPLFVSWLGIERDAHWLDVGCGTGALAHAILAEAHPASVVGCDPSADFVDHSRRHHVDERLSFLVAGVGELPGHPDGFDAVVSQFALNFFPDPHVAVNEMKEVASAHGVVAACVWDYADGMKFLRHFWDAACALDSTAVELDEGRRFPICTPDALRDLFSAAGLNDVRVSSIDITTSFNNFDDYWKPFLGGQGPAPTYAMSLAETDRERLREHLRETLPVADDASISLPARAWAVKGRV